MADEGGDWFGAGDDEPPPVLKPIKKKKDKAAKAAAKEAPPPEPVQAAPPEGEGEGKEEAADEEYLDPDKLLLFKHWIRPKFLGYKVLYDYRKNYYDDVIEVIASRRRGMKRNIPPAQTWAERMVRLHKDPVFKLDRFDKYLDDIRFVTKTEVSRNFSTYYNKEQFNRRFSKLLF